MHEGSLPTVSIYGTWIENVEVWDIDTDTPFDLSGLSEITLKLRDPGAEFDEMLLTMSNGDITVPDTGVLQWRVEASAMGTLQNKLYEVIILLEDTEETVVPLFLGPISVIE